MSVDILEYSKDDWPAEEVDVSTIVNIHTACITNDGSNIMFLPPFDLTEVEKFWQDYVESCHTDKRTLFVAVDRESRKTVGVVMLGMPHTYTGPHRGMVERLIVDPEARRRGIASQLMAKLEEHAKKKGRTLIMLDTAKGGKPELFYQKSGWTCCGVM